MLIGELSRKMGLAPSAVRFYEQEGLIPRAPRRAGRRVFDERALTHLTVVRLAIDAGFTLAEIRRLVNEFGKNRWRSLAQRKLGEVRRAAERLQAMTVLLEKLLRCACPDIDVCGRAIARSASRPGPKPPDKSRLGVAPQRRTDSGQSFGPTAR
jgi:DNA-binding transcriptional MerR regulator